VVLSLVELDRLTLVPLPATFRSRAVIRKESSRFETKEKMNKYSKGNLVIVTKSKLVTLKCCLTRFIVKIHVCRRNS
jgi:hypothetical protein